MTSSEKVRSWRRRMKLRVIKSMGGSCIFCGYNKCQRAMDLHHLDPAQKEFSLGRIMANPVSWTTIVNELRKCILVCCRCHAEVHDGMLTVPFSVCTFNEEFALKPPENSGFDDCCPVCLGTKPCYLTTCSKTCAAKLTGHFDWEKIDLKERLILGESIQSIADSINLSAAAVWKRIKKLGLSGLGRRIGEEKICPFCESRFKTKSINQKYCSSQCSSKKRRLTDRPSKTKLTELLLKNSWVEVGKMYGVSDNAIRKWAKSFGINLNIRQTNKDTIALEALSG